ncbi:MAG TPA: nucleotidyltransferase domain-containing protein [Stackebrandtia sp.]|jgi:hypothetical protein|uniref:nucleotidyltransferase domain-containing protein n=1 Tax=Stackebrandtia sp. TaxID=2023065 RepID=UPI002D5B84A8|nr:nucleotidyltransferase domain-containing protein [Stackebrandtia sp.]HZE39111.1 nucleotidyltransferase domain-containing protein [Stackebrandtia sp.]
MSLPTQVAAVTGEYLSTCDKDLPGRVVGLYLYGSVALDDFRPGVSDVDFVAVLDGPADHSTARALRRVHERLGHHQDHPRFDGVYVTWEDLAIEPDGTHGPYAFANKFHMSGDFERGPVTWHTLAQCGVTVRGPAVDGVKFARDAVALTEWTHTNLDGYWRDWWKTASNSLSRISLWCLRPQGAVWAVLGVSRLHYTLSTGRVTSKTGAGEYAREIFDTRWHRIIDDALRVRRGEPSGYRNPISRRADTLAYLDMVIDDAHRQDPEWRPSGNTR